MGCEPELGFSLGNYAAGERFWDRQREVAEISAYLRDGQSLLITGPRRVGKTSLVRAVLAGLTEARTAFVDVEDLQSPAAFVASLGAEASRDAGTLERVRRWFGTRLGALAERTQGVEVGLLKVELQAAVAGSWRTDAVEIVRAVAGDGPRAVVAVDELPLLVNRLLERDREEAEALLSTMRSLAQQFPAVVWVVSGSIGLEPVLHRAGLTGMVTHLRAYPVEPWDPPTTAGAARALARTKALALEPGAADAVVEALGLGVPYHVQLLVDELARDAARRGASAVTAADVRRVYAGPFLSSAVRASMLHLESRLLTVLGEGDLLRLARDLLTQAAVASPLTAAAATALAADLVRDQAARPAALREALEVLEHDAYLVRRGGGWQFASRLVRDWWRQGNELGFVRAEERGLADG